MLKNFDQYSCGEYWSLQNVLMSAPTEMKEDVFLL